jgi:dihydroorotase-like cyclic amidohydrolase
MLDPASGVDALRDILLDGDRIAAVAPQGQLAERSSGADIFDAQDLIVAPGFIDLHCANRAGNPRKPLKPEHARRRVEASRPFARCPIRVL